MRTIAHTIPTHLALMVSALAACTTPDPTSTAAAPASARAAATQESLVRRQFSGQCETAFSPPPMPLPPSIRQIDTGSCQLAHLGRSAFYAEQDISFATGTAVSVEVRFTAANGDVLRATSVGAFVPNAPGVRITATMTFVGGTGRFANAVGEARLEGQANFATNTTTFSFVDGWISLTAADRSGV